MCIIFNSEQHGHAITVPADMLIGYNASLLENAFSYMVPRAETKCKYCQVDHVSRFSLVKHLLSPAGCMYRPFLCMLCNNGFTKKDICSNHISQQHTYVPQNFNSICIYETEEGELENSSSSIKNSSGFSLPAGISGQRASSCYITSPPVVKVKVEVPEEQDQPLDFSVKSSVPKPTKVPRTESEPMDLSSANPYEEQLRQHLVQSSLLHAASVQQKAFHSLLNPQVSNLLMATGGDSGGGRPNMGPSMLAAMNPAIQASLATDPFTAALLDYPALYSSTSGVVGRRLVD